MLEERIDLAFKKLGLRESFIAACVSRCKRIYDDPRVTTGATDGTSFYFNREFCDAQNDEQLFGLVLHEAMHVVLMHPWRRDDREGKLWNYANDAVINPYIRQRQYQLPENGVYISWVTDKHSSEEVYAKLKQEQQEQQQQQGSGSGSGDGEQQEGGGQSGGGDEQDSGGFDGQGDVFDAVDEAARTEMEATIITAAKMAKECGNGSSLIDRVLGEVGKSKVHWRELLRSMLTESAPNDYSYRRPSRRFIGEGLYLPSLWTEAVGGLAIGFDTSGSMSQKECNQIAGEIQAIADDLNPAFIEVIYCDSEVKGVERFEQGEELELNAKGGGGTRFKPVFDHVESTGDRYAGLIYFTDMYGNLNECNEPEFPVIWANFGGGNMAEPFGTQVEVTL